MRGIRSSLINFSNSKTNFLLFFPPKHKTHPPNHPTTQHKPKPHPQPIRLRRPGLGPAPPLSRLPSLFRERSYCETCIVKFKFTWPHPNPIPIPIRGQCHPRPLRRLPLRPAANLQHRPHFEHLVPRPVLWPLPGRWARSPRPPPPLPRCRRRWRPFLGWLLPRGPGPGPAPGPGI